MAEYVAAVRMDQTIESLQAGQYDPSVPTLSNFYAIDPLSSQDRRGFPARLRAVNDAEFAAGDPLTTSAQFAEQATDPGVGVFARFATEAGAGYTVQPLVDEKTVQVAAVTAPGGKFAAQQAVQVPIDAVAAADQVGLELEEQTISNLRPIVVSHYAHRDATVWDRFRRSFAYVEAVSRIRGI